MSGGTVGERAAASERERERRLVSGRESGSRRAGEKAAASERERERRPVMQEREWRLVSDGRRAKDRLRAERREWAAGVWIWILERE
jgi:hypothetical protein